MTFLEAFRERQRLKNRLTLLRCTVAPEEYKVYSKRVKELTKALKSHEGQAFDNIFLPQ